MALVRIADAFLSSTEFTERFPSLSNAEFIDLLYAQGFGRQAEDGASTTWIKALDTGVSRPEILSYFSSCEEMLQTVGNRANAESGFWTI